MNPTHSSPYKLQTVASGWTRIDMLLALYDRTIVAVRSAAEAKRAGSDASFWQNYLKAQKCLAAIQSGLNPEISDIATNTARLLHFCLSQLSAHRFDEAEKILESMRRGFEAIREEATQLEMDGQIPPLDYRNQLDRTA